MGVCVFVLFPVLKVVLVWGQSSSQTGLNQSCRVAQALTQWSTLASLGLGRLAVHPTYR